MTPRLPPAIKATLAIERALERLSDDDRAAAIAMCFPRSDPHRVARLEMALKAIIINVDTTERAKYPNWIVKRIAAEALA